MAHAPARTLSSSAIASSTSRSSVPSPRDRRARASLIKSLQNANVSRCVGCPFILGKARGYSRSGPALAIRLP
jgi:hypothetical protein